MTYRYFMPTEVLRRTHIPGFAQRAHVRFGFTQLLRQPSDPNRNSTYVRFGYDGSIEGRHPMTERLAQLCGADIRQRDSFMSRSELASMYSARKLCGAIAGGRLPKNWAELRARCTHTHVAEGQLGASLTQLSLRYRDLGRRSPVSFSKVYEATQTVFGTAMANKLRIFTDTGAVGHVDHGIYAIQPDGSWGFLNDISDDYYTFVTVLGTDNIQYSTTLPYSGAPTTISCTLAHRDWLEAHRYYERNETYYHEYYVGPSDEFEDEDEDEDEDSRDGLEGYHSSSRQRDRAVRLHESIEGDALKGDRLTLGFEAEIQTTDARREAVAKIKAEPVLSQVTVCESDGSLNSSDGFETITGWSTMPTVCDWAERYCNIISGFDYYTDNAGLHIAVGGLTQLHVARVYGFVFDTANRPLLRDMAGRDYNSYAGNFSFQNWKGEGRYGYAEARLGVPVENFKHRRIAANVVSIAKKGPGSGRYSGLNYRSAGDRYGGTLEWRLFEATGSSVRLVARLQFVWAVCKYTDPTACNPLTTDDFLAALVHDPYLRRHTKELREYIVRTSQHEARFPAFATQVKELRQRALKKQTHLTKKVTVVDDIPPFRVSFALQQVKRPDTVTLNFTD